MALPGSRLTRSAKNKSHLCTPVFFSSLINHCKGALGNSGIPLRRNPRKVAHVKAENGSSREQQRRHHPHHERVVGVVTGPEAVIPMPTPPTATTTHCCHHHQGIAILHHYSSTCHFQVRISKNILADPPSKPREVRVVPEPTLSGIQAYLPEMTCLHAHFTPQKYAL